MGQQRFGANSCCRHAGRAPESRRGLDVREESGRIVIEPAQRKEYDLAELVKQITVENLHDEADFGRPVGKEAL